MRTVVIYHGGACFDGFCAAWVLKHAHPDAEFVPAQHGEPPPDVTGANVIVADFSYKRAVMLDLIRQTRGNLTVLDHHKTAQAELAGIDAECYRDTLDRLPMVVFDMNKSGGRLAWEYGRARAVAAVRLHGGYVSPGQELDGFFVEVDEGGGLARFVAPWLVDYTEDRDLWRWALPHSREINAALRSYPLDFAEWDRLHQSSCESELRWEGAAILRAEQRTVDSHVRHAREIHLGGHRVLCVNATTLTSEIAGSLAADRPFGVCYFDREDGQRIWSLRSRDGGVDVSEIAKRFGGGGHRNAAGFQTAGVAVSIEDVTVSGVAGD